VLIVGAASVLVFAALALCAHLAMSQTGGEGDLRQWAMSGERPLNASVDGWQGTAGMLMGWWAKVAMLMLVALVVSLVHAGGTMLYLAMRQVCDGQDVTDVWDPKAETRVGAARIDEGEEE
jgi:hypothetical protein